MSISIVRNSLQEYRENFKLSAIFGILLVFVFFFLFFENLFVSSGSIFIEYRFANLPLLSIALEFIAILVFLLFYSIFVSFVIFNVRRHLTKMKEQYYLSERLHRFGFRLFVFFFAETLLFFVIASLLTTVGVPVAATSLLLLLVGLLLLFVPQAIVVDESSISSSVRDSIDFLRRQPALSLKVFVVAMLLVGLLPVFEMIFDVFYLMGRFVALIALLVFVVPFIEILKSRAYLTKFDLVKPHA